MTVSEIVPFDKKRSRVYLDGEYAFLLYRGELRDYHIEQGTELSEDVYGEIMHEVLPKRAKLRAMHLLQKQDYTERKLREKLNDGCYPESCIDEAVEYVKSFHYIDDRRYATDYVQYYMDLRSRNRIETDLMKKGISRELIQEILTERYEEADPQIEVKQVQELLRKKHYDPENCELKEKQKLMAFLYRRGFSQDVIHRALSLDITPD
ncbi:MAG: recombination regulator RecX [Butyrivibrio sp.]|jgi:regulatory protein|nr:recombination regulator RecX [Butyrivibrio sp.]